MSQPPDHRRPGSNLPDFRATQLDFAAHIRNPALHPRPADIEARRMQIYVDLVYKNIENFVAGAYPVFRSCLTDPVWDGLVREFVHTHASESPYFLEVSEEFLAFLDERGLSGLPAFSLELCHYEWVELALDVADDPVNSAADPGDLVGAYPSVDGEDLDVRLTLTPFMRALTYRWAVHKIGPGHQPVEPPAQPCHLIVYRDAALKVRFMESNPVTHRLLDLLPAMSVREALERIALELNDGGRAVPYATVRAQGRQVLDRLRDAGIILGAAPN